MSLGGLISCDWQSSAEGETILQHFYNPQTSGRKVMGILENPNLASSIEQVSYKIMVAGKSGVGKTSTVARFAGTRCETSYIETHGIQKSNVFWPVKMWNKIILFKLQFWDAGDGSLKKYSHILPTCRDKADAILYVFSLMDSNGLKELLPIMSKLAKHPGEPPANIAIGTRYSPSVRLELQPAELQEFELKWQVPVLQIDNRWSGNRAEVHEVAPLLNKICEKLWIRDHEFLMKQDLASSRQKSSETHSDDKSSPS